MSERHDIGHKPKPDDVRRMVDTVRGMTTRNLYLNPDPSMAGKPYQPSNGTEGMSFMELFCEKCKKDDYFRGGENLRCDILTATFIFPEDDPDYPAEWTHRADGQPTCTAFEEEA